jgi:predicted TIM-barrel fold metal-dependent hydrolase
VFLWTGAALACTDLIVNGVLERHPDLRIGIVELSALWIPLYLMMLDGGVLFTSRLNGRAPARLSLRPSDYFRRQIRVSAFAYEQPVALREQLGGDVLMCGSDYPHSEGTETPAADYGIAARPEDAPGLFAGNAEYLLRSRD